MDKIEFSFIDIEIPDFNPEFFVSWISEVLKKYEKDVSNISFMICSDEYLLGINKEYLDHDYYTDIITFNYNEENSLGGDIFISYERVKENALEFSDGNVKDELCRVVVHGVLHLIGFDDKTDEEKVLMRKEETDCLTLRSSFT